MIAAYVHNSGTGVLIAVLTFTGWSYTARQLRAQALSLRNRDFLAAARARGERAAYIIAVEILPTMSSLLVAAFLTNALYDVPFASSLQFIGLGDPNAVSWGTMLYWAQNNEALQTGYYLQAIVPRRSHRAARRGVRPAQLRVRRDRQSSAAADAAAVTRETGTPHETETPHETGTARESRPVAVAAPYGGQRVSGRGMPAASPPRTFRPRRPGPVRGTMSWPAAA